AASAAYLYSRCDQRQLDAIIAWSKAVVSADDVNSLAVHTFSVCPAHLRVLQLAAELKFALEGQICAEDKETLRRQMPSATAHSLLLWIDRRSAISVNVQGSGKGESYQERLSRLEEDKESLVLQVSVLTDQVKAQGEKIRDLENSLGEYQHKLNSTEEMLQQELLKRSSLESQKLGLMEEVSCLKLKLENMEEKHIKSAERQHKAEHSSGMPLSLSLSLSLSHTLTSLPSSLPCCWCHMASHMKVLSSTCWRQNITFNFY
uniref:PPFIA binding protein 2a n=1 Tax=Sinocyclocheilus rhinocerous TaxID=307959 RepID=A0A673MHZ5_9TELE